ncbi:DegV family protein [Aliibacillus thermotolerans]|uniref:DegV family protein n=1 Tax=Aliibacillus thermotolerans TaxID=1834418 RepID=A0ABW0U3I5_9BACI|nr:DegV family protein [Aliibacillus thermotolerans]MDA3130654.1 DegV family EDD domain-containing protein [Aliibacillus thermotolerans]
MGNVHIVTDSTADIPPSFVEKYHITVVPLKVTIEEETYQDGVTLSADTFYEKLAGSEAIPTTSQPTPQEFEKVYRRLYKQNKDSKILSIHLSGKMSGTLQSAQIAANEVAPEVHVEVVDSKRASYAFGIIVVELAKLVQLGATFEECKSRLQMLLQQTSVYFLVDTLHYLQKNGRIGKASALIGSLLKMKPVLSLTDSGEVYAYQKARGTKKAFSIIKEALQKQYGNKDVHLGIAHANALQSATNFQKDLEKLLHVQSTTITTIGAVIGSHTGPGTVAFIVTPVEDGER